MANVDTESESKKKGPGVKKAKRLDARVDLTAMVDVCFLLIMFFIFTTTMAQPSAMDLQIPKDTPNEENKSKIKDSGAFTVILAKDNRIFYYEGMLKPEDAERKEQVQETNYKDIRGLIINKKRSTNPDDFMVVIKPTKESNYKNTVDMLDEMTINVVERYALVDVAETELHILEEKGAN